MTQRSERALSRKSTPELLRQEARRWQRAVQAGDPAAIARLTAAWPEAPANPSRRDIQHALAREYGFAGWTAVLAAVNDFALDRQQHAERVDALLRHGWDGDRTLARRLVTRFPALAQENVFTAATCGDVDTVTRLLQRDPALARQTGGPHAWTPLAYVCYGRVDSEHALRIATLLLDAGADPNATFNDGWDNPFTCLTGAIGLGEGVKPSHPQVGALVALLLDRGADPFDTQALYNDSIAHDDPHWLATLWAACERAGRTAEWHAVDGRSLGGRIKVGTLNYLLGNAITNHHPHRAAWLLAHGASAHTRHSYSGQPVHTVARLAGFTDLVALLEAHGATAEALAPTHALQAAVMAGDDASVRALVAADASLLRYPLLPVVAGHGHARGVAVLLDLGADINARDAEGATALHRAAHRGAVEVLQLLLSRGAEVDSRDPRWQATPLGWSVATGRHRSAALLAPVSRDVRALARSGRVARLAEVLRAEPALATERSANANEPTVLFCLPGDEDAAADVAALLVAAGADVHARNAQGQTAAAVAAHRGLDDAAEVLASVSDHHNTPRAP